MNAKRSRPGVGTEAATRVLAGELNWVQYTTRGIDDASPVIPFVVNVAMRNALFGGEVR